MRLCKDCAFFNPIIVENIEVRPFCESRARYYTSPIDGTTLTDPDSIVDCWERNPNGKCYDYVGSDMVQEFNIFKSIYYFWKWRYKRAGVKFEATK